MESVRFREALAGNYKSRCDTVSVWNGILSACPWMVDICRSAPVEDS